MHERNRCARRGFGKARPRVEPEELSHVTASVAQYRRG
jgi:hypothetical protein